MAALEDAQIPGQLTVDDCIREAESEAPPPVVFTNVTPSGITVEYSPAPKRFYRVNGEEVPSVTTINDCLKKDLSWWGMQIGTAGVLELFKRGVLRQDGTNPEVTDASDGVVVPEDVVKFLTEQKLTVRHTLKRAGDRGDAAHSALEDWCNNGTIPHPEIYPEAERPYVEGLCKFFADFGADFSDVQTEIMVGSAAHKFAGRYDFRCNWGGGAMVTKIYPKWPAKVTELPAGRYLLDLKTAKSVFKEHALQLAAYEGASVECGYEPTDYRAVIHVTKTGEYELVVTTATLEDFLSVRATYEVMQKRLVA